MGPPSGLIVRNAAGSNAVEGDERLARPESREPVTDHAVAAGGWIVDFDRVGPKSRCDHDEMTPLDPHERWKRQLCELHWIPSHGKDAKPGGECGGSEIRERSATRRSAGESAKTVGRRHGKSG
jgi:hypothetical protein